MRLYRRGFETTELRAGQNVAELDWTEATDLAAQEKAVDDLLGVSPLKSTSPLKPVRGTGVHSPPALELGTKSSGHMKALLFAASEYEWLALQVSGPYSEEEEMHNRLLAKARRLHDLASGKVEK